MNKLEKPFLFLLLFLIFQAIGCISSLVYSPSLNLPPQPLQYNDGQAIAGYSSLAETRPDRVNQNTSPGEEFLFRFGISNHVSLQIKAWKDISEDDDKNQRNGLSIGSLIALNDSMNTLRFGLMPMVGVVFDISKIEGGGGYCPFIIWLPHYKWIYPSIAFGPIVGIRDIVTEPDKKQWGWGIISNFGIGFRIVTVVHLNAEISYIIQNDEINHLSYSFFSPSVSLGINF